MNEILFLLFIFIGISVPMLRFISLDLYRKKIQGRYYLPISLAILGFLLIFILPEKISTLLIGPIMSLLIFDYGENWYLKKYREPVFEVDENKFDQSTREIRMGIFDSILTTTAIMVPLLTLSQLTHPFLTPTYLITPHIQLFNIGYLCSQLHYFPPLHLV